MALDPTLVQPLRDALAALPGTRIRPMFGAEAFFAGPVLFAFLGAEGVVLRLPGALRAEALRSGQVKGFLGPLPEGLSGWVTVPYGTPADALMASAHALARGLARSAARMRGRTSQTSRKRRKRS